MTNGPSRKIKSHNAKMARQLVCVISTRTTSAGDPFDLNTTHFNTFAQVACTTMPGMTCAVLFLVVCGVFRDVTSLGAAPREHIHGARAALACAGVDPPETRRVYACTALRNNDLGGRLIPGQISSHV